MKWEMVLGLEVHAQLNTQSKLFSDSATHFGRPPNTQTSFIDAGLPGVLPVLNQQAVYKAIQFGLAIHATINNLSFFERKNYFYPDLPKGYQISQYQRPIISNGFLPIDNKKIIIERAHLEEDAGKSVHNAFPDYTGVDLNRAGMPLLEIVTTPCLSNAVEVVSFLKNLQQLLRFLNLCDGNMQEGSLRCDVNLSLRPQGRQYLGTRTELKNLNSFRYIEKAIYFEAARHQDILEQGQPIIQQTRLYHPETNTTLPMRDKENEDDYRYFPDPDLLPIEISPELLAKLKSTLPPTPKQLAERLHLEEKLNEEDIQFLLTSPAHLNFYKDTKTGTRASPEIIINWLKGNVLALLNELGLNFATTPISAHQLSRLLNGIIDQRISVKVAKKILWELPHRACDVDELISAEAYEAISNQAIDEMIRKVIAAYPQQTAEYRAGKGKLYAFFVGQIMKQTKGQAAPEQVNALLKKYLEE